MGSNEPEASFRRDGFAKLGLTIEPSLLDRVAAACEALLQAEAEEDRARVKSLGSLISVFRAPSLAPLIADPSIGRALSDLGFEDLRFSAGYLISKPPRGPASFWHQDWGFWDEPCSYRPATPQASLLFYLCDVTPDNGCPRFLPGSHLCRHEIQRALDHADPAALRRMDDPEHAAFVALPDEVSVPLGRGEVVLFDPRVLHAAHENRALSPRHGLVLWYYVGFSALPESIQAFASRGDPTVGWPEEARRQIDPLLPRYPGAAEPAILRKHPAPPA
jgi:hypothetical protein